MTFDPTYEPREGLVHRDADWSGLRVLVVGLGVSGFAAADALAERGARVTVVSRDVTDAISERARVLEILDVDVRLGPEHLAEPPEGTELVVTSPGVPPHDPLMLAAATAGIPVWGEVELAWRMRAKEGAAPWLTVTGTNGKTTTTALAAHLCRGAGLHAVAAGNIRPAMLDALGAALDAGTLPQAWVIELSSFQLALAQSFAPDAAAILNVSEDHLDWHATMDSYVAAKRRIYAPGTVAVFDREDPATAPLRTGPTPASRGAAAGDARASGNARVAVAAAPLRIAFGADAPQAAGEFGLVREGSLTWLAQAVADDDTGIGRRRREPVAFTVRRLMPADALRIHGVHNQLNALAALALCSAIGVPMAKMLHALRDYAGEPHRCQLLASIDGVEYYDDSKGTNVGATIAALRGLGRRCRLIAGGDGKGQDFAALAGAVREHATAVYLIGRDAPQLRAALSDTGVPLVDCASLEEAAGRAGDDARPGEAVLLSPACASLDMFRNYEHRAQVFAAAVRQRAEARGVAMEGAC